MQNDLISRQAAIDAIQKAYVDTEGGEDKRAVWKNVGLTNALHIMYDLPPAQLAHGHWEERYIEDAPIFLRDRFYCSACENWNTYGKPKYCPHCGAKMDEVTE